MKKSLLTLFILIIAGATNSILCSDLYPSIIADILRKEVEDLSIEELIIKGKISDTTMFRSKKLGLSPEAWQLFKTRAAIARLAYNAGQSYYAVNEFMGSEEMYASGASLQDRINQLRIKALEAGLVENINDLVALEEIEDTLPENETYKRVFEGRMFW